MSMFDQLCFGWGQHSFNSLEEEPAAKQEKGMTKAEISSMFAVIRSDRLREQEDESYLHTEDRRETREQLKRMLQQWEDERQSIMRGAEMALAVPAFR